MTAFAAIKRRKIRIDKDGRHSYNTFRSTSKYENQKGKQK
ncbi:hypothetical protein HOLDEFILI_01673 [Holdemania filiformis DSM 12042]|uniref:Uncharacterized protein n=1 Tax=Holdemania filiformis DSM 12042 TaxID=545696 RepID=B9Y778_9FIRM|nr:hypothetical protein HOLDEFILI_01673 [Holdemania filiformis DSM 12042]